MTRGDDADGEVAPPKKATTKQAAQLKAANAHLGRVYRPEEVVVPSFLEDIPPVRKEVAQYFTGVARFDVSFGKLMEALKAAGHDDDTLVVFLSDHGMSFPFSKATVYRNGTWSPVIFRGPGPTRPQLQPGVDRDQPGQQRGHHAHRARPARHHPSRRNRWPLARPLDARRIAAGARSRRDPCQHGQQRVGFPPTLRADQKRVPSMFHAWADGKTAFRVEAMSGLSYAAMAAAASPTPGSRDGSISRHRPPLAFYNLEDDPDERRNLIDDPQSRAEIEQLRTLLLAHMERTGDPQLENFQQAFAAWSRSSGSGR